MLVYRLQLLMIFGMISTLLIAGCWLSKKQPRKPMYPYEKLSDREIKKRSGILDSVKLDLPYSFKAAMLYEDKGIDQTEILDTSFNDAYIGKRETFVKVVNPLARVMTGYDKITKRGYGEVGTTDVSKDTIHWAKRKIFKGIDTQLAEGYRDHVLSMKECEIFVDQFLKKYAVSVRELNKPNIQSKPNSDSLKSHVFVMVDFDARKKVDSFYYFKKDTLITKTNISNYEDYFIAYKQQTVKFGFYNKVNRKTGLNLKIDGTIVDSEHAGLGTTHDEIEYHIK